MTDVGCTLHMERFGDGVDLVMIHGWGMHGGVWRPFARDLAARGLRVTCVDLPGHGRSADAEEWSLRGIGDSLLQVLPPRSAWLGWSLGGILALDMASRHPCRVDQVVVMAGNARFVGGDGWPGMEHGLLEGFAAQLARDCPAALARFAGLQVRGAASPRSVLKDLRACLEACGQPSLQTLMAALKVLRESDVTSVLPRLQCSGLIIMGGGDALVPVAAGAAMAGLWRTAQLHVVADGGHVPFLSQPQATVELIADFLNTSPEKRFDAD